MYKDISQLTEFDYSENEKVTNRWKHEGRNRQRLVEELISDGAGEDFLEYDYQYGILKDFLKDEWDLRGIRLNSINLDYPGGENFQFINFSYSNFHNCVFKGCIFDATFFFVGFENCKFIDCIFANSYFKGCYFENCKFNKIDFFSAGKIDNCNFTDTDFLNFFCPQNLLVDCKITSSSSFSKPLSQANNRNWNYTFKNKCLSDFYNQLNSGFKESGASQKASDYRYKSAKSYTRYNTDSFFKKWKRILIDELIIGYGERPSRTLITSIVIILIFASIYLLQGYGENNTNFLNSLYISFSAFVVFGIDSAKSSSKLIRFLFIIEAFLGTTLIGAWTALLLKKIIRQ